MATDLVGEERRMRSALVGAQYVEALQVCERLRRALRTAIAESSPRANHTTINGARSGRRSADWMRLSKLAHHLGVDARTLRVYIEDEPFVEHPTERVWNVNLPKFYRWFAARGRTLRKGRRRDG